MPRPNGAETGERRLQLVLGLLVIGLTAFTIFAFITPGARVAVVNERIDLIINTVATIGAGAIAALAWARYRVTRESAEFYRTAAFLTLAAVNASVMAVLAADRGKDLGFSLDAPGPLPIVSFVLARFVAAALLLIGGIAAVRHTGLGRWASGLLVVAPAVLTLALLAVIRRTDIPSPLSSEALRQLQQLPDEPIRLSALTFGLLAIQLIIGAMFLGAAWLAYRSAVDRAHPSDAFFAIGFILAAFSQVHYAVNPGSYAALVTTGDLLRVAFYAVLLAGVIVQSRSDVRQIEEANAELRLLRDAEVNRALVEERGRLAREMHDGLAQDLWYARLKQGKLVQLLQDDEERALAADVMDAIDSGIADSRQAVMAMRAGSTDAPLLEIVQRYVEDFGDRFALDVRFEPSGEAPELPARVQAEVLRIVQEALNNVRKHADATVVRIAVVMEEDSLRISVADNGRGFAPEQQTGGFGLLSMRQRAELIGATIRVDSGAHDGTRVSLALPLGSAR